MSDLKDMVNIGAEMERKLRAVGIDSAEALAVTGAEAAFLRLMETYPNVCLVHLYVLEGAVTGTEYNRLPEERRRELKQFSDFLKDRGGRQG